MYYEACSGLIKSTSDCIHKVETVIQYLHHVYYIIPPLITTPLVARKKVSGIKHNVACCSRKIINDAVV